MTRLLALAAGTLAGLPAPGVIEAAAGGGFDACGLRLGPADWSPAVTKRLRQHVDTAGIRVLDVEVVRLRPEVDLSVHERLLDAAAVVGASWVLTVSDIPDVAGTSDAVAGLCRLAGDRSLGVALEFMRFTSVRTLVDAARLLESVNCPELAILVDALHLDRSGGAAAELAQLPADALAYAQLCDACAALPTSDADLAEEARHRRLMPGEGTLQLSDFVRALPPDLTVSVEVQSDLLASQLDPEERAAVALASAQRVLALNS